MALSSDEILHMFEESRWRLRRF
ncbi:hypothetical protein Gogos_002118 [Gossypium gossypioides]|uniref:Uncharacterized protein n=1 Tax=Gossypium gossypioides TaxID=34282 RepID=A0A7J9CQW0_GOSGO|nr:hypothetical protein [Gossypium gossypioides]